MKKILLGLAVIISLLLIAYIVFHKKISEKANQTGIELYKTEQYEDAAISFKKAVKYHKANFDAQTNLVRALLVLEEYSEAGALLLKMEEMYPENAERMALSGQLFTLQEKFEEALIVLDQAIAIQDDLAFAYYYRGIARANLNDLDGAAADYKKAQEIDESNIDALEQRATILSQLMNYEEAIKNYNKLIEADPSNTNAFLKRGKFKMEIGDYAGAIDDFTNAVSLDTKLAEAYFNRGKSFAQNGQFENALADFIQSAQLSYKLASAYFNAGLAALNLSDTKQAEKYLSLTIKNAESGEQKANAYQLLGVLNMMKTEYNSAIKNFTQALELNAEHVDAYYNRGISYGLLKEYQKAINDLEESKKLGKNSSDLYFALGVNKISLNNFAEGCAELKMSAEMGNPQASEMRKQYCKNQD